MKRNYSFETSEAILIVFKTAHFCIKLY